MAAGKSAPTLTELIENLRAADRLVRVHAATALGALGEAAEPAVTILVRLLRVGDVQDRRLAALTLGEIASEDAIPALCDAADDPDPGVAEMAEWALEQIGEDEEAA